MMNLSLRGCTAQKLIDWAWAGMGIMLGIKLFNVLSHVLGRIHL